MEHKLTEAALGGNFVLMWRYFSIGVTNMNPRVRLFEPQFILLDPVS